MFVSDYTAEKILSEVRPERRKPNGNYQLSTSKNIKLVLSEQMHVCHACLINLFSCFKWGNKKFICLKVVFFTILIHEINAVKKEYFKLQTNDSARLPGRNAFAPGVHGIVGSRMVTSLQRRCWERPVAGACRPYITAGVI